MQPVGQPAFIRVLKLDEDLDLVWESDFWGDSLGCELRALGLDESERVWIGGHTEEPSSRVSPLIVRFESDSGSVLGQRVWNFYDKPEAEIRYFSRGAGNGMYALGQSELEGPGLVFLSRLDSLGTPRWAHELPETARAVGLQRADSLEVIVAIARYAQDTLRYKTLRYEESTSGGWPVYNEDGDPLYMSNRVIVRFNPGIMNLGFIDEPDQEFGKLSDAITSTTLPLLIDTLLGVQGTSADWDVYKIFPYWNSGIQTITSRLGQEIPLPKLWSALILKIDSATLMNPIAVSDSLMQLPYFYIRYAHPTILGQLSTVPNDPFLGEQYHLWNTTSIGEYADAHIRMDSVWANFTWDTSRVIRAGVIDSGVRFTHEDFDCEDKCPPETLNGTVVYLNKDFHFDPSGNYDIMENDILDLAFLQGGHGTNVAGLLGAISNNGKGISGVAGGDFEAGIPGVLIQNYRISDTSSIVANAISSAIGWAIDLGEVNVMNSSLGFESNNSQWASNQNILREIYRLAYRANVIAVNSRGNKPNNSENIPATLRDDWGISVGASGTDGHIAISGLNTGDTLTFYSKYGLDMDVMAPGASPQLQKTISYSSDTGYKEFAATSASAPQVAGLAAWVLNQTPNSLAVEDVEHLIEYAAADKNTDSIPPYFEIQGYDERSGWGLIDAGATLDLLNASKVIRARLVGADEEFVSEIDGISCDSYLGCLVDLNWPDPDTSISPGQHLARIYRYTANFSYNVCQELGATFQSFSDTAKLPFWVLNSLSPYFGPATAAPGQDYLELNPWEDSRFQNVVWDSCSVSGKIVGYKYEFLTLGGEPLMVIDSIFLPATGENDFFFSLLVKADTPSLPDTILLEDLVSVYEVEEEPSSKLSLWPNPFDHQIRVQVPQGFDPSGMLQVFDLHGRLVFQQDIPAGYPGQISIATTLWPSGAYFIRVISPTNFLSAKAIKF